MTGCRVVVAVVMVALVGATLIEAQAGKGSGTMVVNGKKFTFQNISAVTHDTASQGRMISMLLSDKPVNPKAFLEYMRIGGGEKYVPGIVTGAWVTMHSDDKALQGFSFTIDPKRPVMLNDVLVGSRSDNFSILDDYLVLELTSTSPRLVGRIRTKDAVVDLGSQKIGLDFTFDTPVMQLGK